MDEQIIKMIIELAKFKAWCVIGEYSNVKYSRNFWNIEEWYESLVVKGIICWALEFKYSINKLATEVPQFDSNF